MLTHYRLPSPFLNLTVQPITPKIIEPPKEVTADHIFIIDCSGSMYGALGELREHLKAKITSLLKVGDTLTVVWFSGRGQFGTVFEGESVKDLAALETIKKQIDRWLNAMGSTGFLEPIRELAAIIPRLARKTKNAASVYFLSDGGENNWPQADVIKAVADTANLAATFTVVEYGNWADRPFLAKMAAGWGGAHIFAESFKTYQPAIEAAVTKTVYGGATVKVKLESQPFGDLAVGISQGSVIAYKAEDGHINVPEHTVQVAYLTGSKQNVDFSPDQLDHLKYAYALMVAFAPLVRSDYIWPLLKFTGDVKLIKSYANCFGKQAYSDFRDLAERAAVDPKARYIDGKDISLVPRDDAYTIIDLLNLLAGTSACIDIDHEEFGDYTKIGRTRVDANTRLTKEEQAKIKELTDKLNSCRTVKAAKDVQKEIDAISNKPEPLKFVETKPEFGYPINGLVMNEERPNISFRVQKFGTVDLTAREGSVSLVNSGVPGDYSKFPTFTYRNFTVIRDGIINIKKLPVTKLDRKTTNTLNALIDEGRLNAEAMKLSEGNAVIFDLTKIPIVSLGQVKRVSAKELFLREWDKMKAQGELKVFKHVYSERYDKKAAGYEATYGAEAAKWLSEQGLVSYSGFAPKVLQTESTDFYIAKVLEVKTKGYSALPSVNDVLKRIEALKPGKELTGPSVFLKTGLDKVAALIAKHGDKTPAFKAELEQLIKDWTDDIRMVQGEIARITFSVILGQVWFTDLTDLSDTKMTLNLDGKDVEFEAVLKEEEVKI